MENLNSPINKDILISLKNGSNKAFEIVYKQYQAQVYRFVKYSVQNSDDTEEIVQEVFIKIWKLHDKIDLDKSFEAFLFRIAKNQIHDFLRKVLLQKKHLETLISDYSFTENELEDIVNYRETEKVLNHLISKLPERRKTAFELSRIHGKSYKEISDIMNVSENTVDTHIRKALAFIREGFIRISPIIFFLIPFN